MEQLVDITPLRTHGLAADLDGNFKKLAAGVEDAEELLRTAIVILHGEGKESGCDLITGTGLWIEVENGAHWINGERYLNEDALTLSLNPSTTSYIYMTLGTDGLPKLIAEVSLTLPSPIGRWYCGVVVTDIDSIVSVDSSEAETVNADVMHAKIVELNEWRAIAEEAIGSEYFTETPPLSSLDARVSDIEAGGGVDADTVKWDTLQRAFGDTTKISQWVDGRIVDHENRLHDSIAGPGGEGGSEVSYVFQEYDVVSANVARGFLMLCRTVCPMLFRYMTDCVGLVWRVSGDGTDEFDHVDWDNSTWVVLPL